jgi:hypothetical protein
MGKPRYISVVGLWLLVRFLSHILVVQCNDQDDSPSPRRRDYAATPTTILHRPAKSDMNSNHDASSATVHGDSIRDANSCSAEPLTCTTTTRALSSSKKIRESEDAAAVPEIPTIADTATKSIKDALLFMPSPLSTSHSNEDSVSTHPTAAAVPPVATVPTWALVLVQWVESLERIWSDWIVPGYTILVTLYLFAVLAFRDRFWTMVTTRRWNSASFWVVSPKPTLQTASTTTTTTPANNLSTTDSLQPPFELQQQPIDLTGSYQLVSSTNVDAFLAAQGVPWALRRLATAAVPIHHFVHVGNALTIKIEAPGSGFATQSVYQIDGPPVETTVRGRLFRDSIRYWYNDDASLSPLLPMQQPVVQGIVTEKHAIQEGYAVQVIRRLVADGSRIDLTSTVSFPNDPTKENVLSSQVFERIVPSR